MPLGRLMAPPRKLLLDRIMKNWQRDSKLIWTVFVFYYCLERIAVRATYDRSTGKITLEGGTDGKFGIDEAHINVTFYQEKLQTQEFVVNDPGEKGLWPVLMALVTKNGTLKLSLTYSVLEDNFVLSVNGLSVRLLIEAGENPIAMANQVAETAEICAKVFKINGIQIFDDKFELAYYEKFAELVSSKTEDSPLESVEVRELTSEAAPAIYDVMNYVLNAEVHQTGVKSLTLVGLDTKTTFQASSLDRTVSTCRNLQVLELEEMHDMNYEGRDALADFVARLLDQNTGSLRELKLRNSGFSAEQGERAIQTLC